MYVLDTQSVEPDDGPLIDLVEPSYGQKESSNVRKSDHQEDTRSSLKKVKKNSRKSQNGRSRRTSKCPKKTVREILQKYSSGKRTSKVDLQRISKAWGENQSLEEMIKFMKAYDLIRTVQDFNICDDVFNRVHVTRVQVQDHMQESAEMFKCNPKKIISKYIRSSKDSNDVSIVKACTCFTAGLSLCTIAHRGVQIPIMLAYLQSKKCRSCDNIDLRCAKCLFASEYNGEDKNAALVQQFISRLPFAPHSIKSVRMALKTIIEV